MAEDENINNEEIYEDNKDWTFYGNSGILRAGISANGNFRV